MPPPGHIIAKKYQIVRHLGQGAMGVVFEAENLELNRRVALKLFEDWRTKDQNAVRRFQREVRASGKIDHDGICEVLDAGVTSEDRLYLVMPLLRGESLRTVIAREGLLPLERACDIVLQALSAIDSAHAASVIHRDIKPEHIFLIQLGDRVDFVKILDFGIAKFMDTTADDEALLVTQEGAIIGTPSYMAPEQASGNSDIDHRVDIYAMGVVFYEMLTGVRPFKGTHLKQVIWSILNETVRPPRSRRSGLPSSLEQIVLRAMQRDPCERYDSAREMREDLIKASSGPFAAELDTLETADFDKSVLEGASSQSLERGREDRGLTHESRRHLGFYLAAFLLVSLALGGAYIAILSSGPSTTDSSLAGQLEEPTIDLRKARSAEVGDSIPAQQHSNSTDARVVSLVRISFADLPPVADVFVDGEQIEGTSVELAASSSPVQVAVKAKGFVDWTQEISARQATTVYVNMLPLASSSRKSSAEMPSHRDGDISGTHLHHDEDPSENTKVKPVRTFGTVP